MKKKQNKILIDIQLEPKTQKNQSYEIRIIPKLSRTGPDTSKIKYMLFLSPQCMTRQGVFLWISTFSYG